MGGMPPPPPHFKVEKAANCNHFIGLFLLFFLCWGFVSAASQNCIKETKGRRQTLLERQMVTNGADPMPPLLLVPRALVTPPLPPSQRCSRQPAGPPAIQCQPVHHVEMRAGKNSQSRNQRQINRYSREFPSLRWIILLTQVR